MEALNEKVVTMPDWSFTNSLCLSSKQRFLYFKIYYSTLAGHVYHPNYHNLAMEMDSCERGVKSVLTTLVRKKVVAKTGTNSYRAVLSADDTPKLCTGSVKGVTKKELVRQYLAIGNNGEKETRLQHSELNDLGVNIDMELLRKYKRQLRPPSDAASAQNNNTITGYANASDETTSDETIEGTDGYFIPSSFFRLKLDTVTELLLLAVIHDFTVKGSGYFMSDARIGEMLGVASITIMRTRAKLLDKGFITRVYDYKSRHYMLKSVVGTKSAKNFVTACHEIGCATKYDLSQMEKCLNCAVLGKARQTADHNELTREEVDEIKQMSDFFIKAVDNGFITDIDGAKAFFRREYNNKFQTLPFDN